MKYVCVSPGSHGGHWDVNSKPNQPGPHALLDPVQIFLVIVAGLAAGIVSGLFGVGGGILMVPAALYLVPGTDFHQAKAASLVVIAFSTGLGIYTHATHNSVDFRRGGYLALGGIAGTALAVVAVERVEDTTLRLLFGLLLAITGLRMLRKTIPREPVVPSHRERLAIVGLGFAGGALAGAFGIGGGILMVPCLVLAGVGIHLAVGTSLVAVLSNSVVATATHLTYGYGTSLALLGIPLAAGAIPGVRIGAKLAHHLHANRLKHAFGLFLILVGGGMMLDAVL